MKTVFSVVLAIGLAAGTAAAEPAKALALDEALALALAQNPDVAEAQSRLAEAEARLRTARAGGGPTLKARGAYDVWTEDQRLFPATQNGESGTFGPQIAGADLIATLPLYTGGRVSGEADAADWSRQAASNQLARARETLAFQVTAQFYGLLAQDEVLRSLETAVQAMDEQQRTIQSLVDAEKAARVDLLRVQVRRAELYERQVRERNNRTIQQRAWAALLGLEDAQAPVAVGTLEARELSPCPDSAACMEKALAQRTDLRAAREAVSAAEAAVRAAQAGFKPTLSAQASYGGRWMLDATDQPEGADDQADAGRIGLVAEIPIFDSQLTRGKVAEQRARLRGAQERLRKLELQIRYEVETALADLLAAQERIQTSAQTVGQAEESFRIVKEKYDLGKGTLTDVLDAQNALVIAQTSLARAQADGSIADARRRLATGDTEQ
ncbi:MAG TPA: TolC family protein [Kiritimatiellia bacterium]|nr:TolC family protein [Kiritimatiellia bacterium]